MYAINRIVDCGIINYLHIINYVVVLNSIIAYIEATNLMVMDFAVVIIILINFPFNIIVFFFYLQIINNYLSCNNHK